MKLSYTFTLIALVALIFTFIGFFISRAYISSVLVNMHALTNENNTKLVEAAVHSISEMPILLMKDRSVWNELIENIENENKTLPTNEVHIPHAMYHADAVWILDKTGAIIFHEAKSTNVNLEKLTQLPIDSKAVVGNFDLNKTITFFDYQDDNTVIAYHIGPFTHEKNDGVNPGHPRVIIIAVVWDKQVIEKIERLTQSTVTITKPYNSGKRSQSNTTVSSYPLRNFSDQEVAILTATFKDKLVTVIGEILSNQVQQTLILGVVGILLCLVFFKWTVIKPMNRLIEKLQTTTSLNTPKIKNNTNSEITALSALIDAYTHQSKKIMDTNDELHATSDQLKKALSELQKSEHKLRTELDNSLKLSKAVESSSDAVVITDCEKRIQYVNPAWQKLNGYTAEEAIGNTPKLIKSNRTNSSVYRHLWEHLLQGNSYTTEQVINKRKDGSLYAARISVFPVVIKNKITNFVGICEDITERVEREHLKSEFISLASHQLRTPLTSLRWMSELLAKKTQKKLSGKEHEIIEDIEDSAIRMTELVNRLLNLSRVETGRLLIHPKQVTLKKFCSDILEELQPLITEKNLQLKSHCQLDHTTVTVDPDLLHEILINILSNAIKYTPKNGTISSKIYAQGDRIYFEVADTGIGIPEDEQHKIFTRFYRASNAQQLEIHGTGLGLYLVKMLVEGLDGEINIISKGAVSTGTKVTFFIPKVGVKKEGEIGIKSSTLDSYK